jgi:hypothetical protein
MEMVAGWEKGMRRRDQSCLRGERPKDTTSKKKPEGFRQAKDGLILKSKEKALQMMTREQLLTGIKGTKPAKVPRTPEWEKAVALYLNGGKTLWKRSGSGRGYGERRP